MTQDQFVASLEWTAEVFEDRARNVPALYFVRVRSREVKLEGLNGYVYGAFLDKVEHRELWLADFLLQLQERALRRAGYDASDLAA